MIIPGHLNFFRIEECGLYKHSSTAPVALEPAETFELIYQWVQGKPMEDTIPWDPASTKSGAAKCYCHDFYKCDETGEFFFVLWKSETDSAGTIWGAQAHAQTGSSNVVEYTNDYKGKKVIWGRPCYYWVIPSLNTVVSIKTEHSVCDSGLFQEWVTKCITNRVSHPNKHRTETETGQVRFEFSESDDAISAKYSFRFNVHLRSINTGCAEMKELAARVTHIVRRDTIKLNTGTDDRAFWVKAFDRIPLLPAKPKAKTRQIEVQAEAKPTPAEIKQIIETFAKEERQRTRTDWNNVGFKTETGTVWVDRYRLHTSVNFNQKNATIFSAAEMHTRLLKDWDRILREVKEDEATKGKRKKKAAGGA